MSDALATRPANGTAGRLAAAPAPLDTFRPLDVYAGGLSDESPRLDALATISAGERGEPRQKDGKTLPGLPQRSTDGTIKLHDRTGRAPALKKALEDTKYKSLTIAFPWDDPATFIQQRFERWSASTLEVYGDHRELLVFEGEARRTVAAGSTEYERLVATCKVGVSVYFALAEWDGMRSAVIFPDGLGFYRLRFTSRNSLRAILNGLRAVGRFTGGRVAGVPFDLRIDYREVSDRTGQRRTVPVWVLVMRPPAAIRLSSGNWTDVVKVALEQGKALRELPPPSEETLALAAWEGPEPDMDDAEITAPSDAQIEALADGGTCDAEHWKRRWGAMVDGTRFDYAAERRKFLLHFTRGRFDSLKAFLDVATEGDAEALVAEVVAEIEADRSEEEEIQRVGSSGHFDEDDDADEGEWMEVEDEDAPAEVEEPAAAAEPTPGQAATDAPQAQAANTAPPKRHSQRELNRFFAQVNPLRPRPTPADIHRILGVEHIQEVADLDAALQAIFEAWRREHPPAAPAATEQGHPAGSIEAAWQRYQAARAEAERWNRDNPSAQVKIAPPPSEREATAVQVEAYAKHLEDQVAKAFQPIAGGAR